MNKNSKKQLQKTKVIMPVHLYGISSEMTIINIAIENKLAIIEHAS